MQVYVAASGLIKVRLDFFWPGQSRPFLLVGIICCMLIITCNKELGE